ncbi:Protein of unknown function [Pyronema omphalodes CBS 100304]|uniref:Uncharacterized protein n=1 Tax=Pyronema omphalodes (strain CBS 100304) TaxID=1076935 RepID=U4L0W6_PYROM|nr:Protein of unknown function [Pyronema omphalodes CBS 100304]
MDYPNSALHALLRPTVHIRCCLLIANLESPSLPRVYISDVVHDVQPDNRHHCATKRVPSFLDQRSLFFVRVRRGRSGMVSQPSSHLSGQNSSPTRLQKNVCYQTPQSAGSTWLLFAVFARLCLFLWQVRRVINGLPSPHPTSYLRARVALAISPQRFPTKSS